MLLNTRASTDTVIWLLDWAVVCLAWLPVFRLVLLEMPVFALAVSRRRSSSVWFWCWFSERLWPCTVWLWLLSLWPWPTSIVTFVSSNTACYTVFFVFKWEESWMSIEDWLQGEDSNYMEESRHHYSHTRLIRTVSTLPTKQPLR